MKDKELKFRSKLSIEEIENNFTDYNYFEKLKASLEEALAYEQGKAASGTYSRKRSLLDVDA